MIVARRPRANGIIRGTSSCKIHGGMEPLGRGSLIGVPTTGGSIMDGIIYLVGVIVIVMAILSFFGLR
jgi:hypothetical protein